MEFHFLGLFQNAKIQDLNVIHNIRLQEHNKYMLFQNAKIQDLNVIHNFNSLNNLDELVVSECKDTRFECNSQLIMLLKPVKYSCFRMQRYKI